MTLIVEISCQQSDITKRVVMHDDEEIVVGRQNRATIIKPDRSLSRKHFVIRYVDGEIEIEHRSVTNPTLAADDRGNEFRQIEGSHRFTHRCRIIAGAHRFIATVEMPQTTQNPHPVELDSEDIWEHPAPRSTTIDVSEDPSAAASGPSDVRKTRPVEKLGQPNRPRFVFDSCYESDAAAPPANQTPPRVAARPTEKTDPEKFDFDEQPEESPAAQRDLPSDDFEIVDKTPATPPDSQPPTKTRKSDLPKPEDEEPEPFTKKMTFPINDSLFDD